MFTTLSVVLAALLSTFDPASVDWIELGERMGLVEAHNHGFVASVQVDLLPDYENAESLANTLRHSFADSPEIEVFVERVAGEAELPPSYRVGLGPFTSFEMAEQVRERAASVGIDGFVRATPEPAVGC